MSSLRIGDLNKRVTLEYPTRTADGLGGHTIVWTESDTVWAGVWPVSAREQIEGSKPSMTITHRIRMRYHADIRADWRIKYAERYFTVESLINPNERGALLDVLCRESAP